MTYYIYVLLCVLAWKLGVQIQMNEWKLLSGKYNYAIRTPQMVTYVATLAAIGVMVYDILSFGAIRTLFFFFVALPVTVIFEWILSKLSPKQFVVSILYRLAVIASCSLLCWNNGYLLLSPFLMMGLFLRNSPLGVVHGKPLFLACRLSRSHPDVTVKGSDESTNNLVTYDVTRYGILPDKGCDVLEKVQQLVDEVGQKGGGCIFFPKGRYLFNKSGGREFLQINYSNITIEGECSPTGELLVELVNCGTTVEGSRNPWLSPFFITTGEQLQHSNIFWGLDFRRPSGMKMVSSSLSDPGSDGKILTPPFATRLIEDAPKGSCRLRVEDSSKVGKYVLLGLYNTTTDGSLIKEILGVETLRPEWTTALRAGVEEAPSFQWLTEVKAVIDDHTVELAHPLLRDCPMNYEPALFNVEMLENIHIRNLSLKSRWNGLFHHHGIPLYYSVGQSQQMDYGWNGINMKRAAHSSVENVELRDFTNPLYAQDSCSVKMSNISISGYDGHQGLKIYCHTCNCLFEDIRFYCHYADMMGGEGNAYANTFRHVRYLNPTFNPVDYDFHGFSEGPMSPPAYNVFDSCEGFRYIKGAGAVFMQPACATGNEWRHCISEGERKGTPLYYAMSYRVRGGFVKIITAVGFTIVMMMKQRRWSPSFAIGTMKEKIRSINRMAIPRRQHAQFFPGNHVEQMRTTATINPS